MGWIKKSFHKFFIDEKGAVSIYAIIITLLLFMFNAVLIDFVRIMAAERETDQAIKAAIRSTMSAYNQDVKGYGLFGFDGGQSEANEIFSKVFEENLKMEEGDYFRFTDTKPEGELTTEISDKKMLANKTTIEYQILEEMKYKAPMEVGKSIIEGFLQVSEAMEQASVYVDIAESIQDDVDKREEKLDKVKEHLTKAQEKSGNSSILLADVVACIAAYQAIVNNPPSADASEEEKAAYEIAKKAAEMAIRAAASALKSELNAVLSELQLALMLVEEAEELNKKVERIIKEKRAEARKNYSNANEAANMRENGSGNANGALGGIAEANERLDDYVIEQKFFDDLKSKINEAIGKVENNISAVEQLLASIPGGLSLGGIDIGGQQAAIDEAVRIITIDRPVIKDEDVNNKDKEADKNLEDVNKQLDEALKEAEKYAQDHALIQEIAVLVKKYQGSMESSKNEFNRDNPDKAAKDAMNFVDKVFEAVGDVLINSRDKVYLNEYILTKYKSHDFKKKGAEGFALENNQVEFIMYGLESTGANYTAAMTELFAFRFAVNFVEAFTQPSVRAFGPYMWVAALAYALLETITDLIKIKTGPIEFFEGIKFNTTYKDYLRIFLFLHPEGNKMARAMALIEHDTGVDLTKLPTYISGEASTSVKLWFLPGVTKMLGQTGVITGRVENNRYFIDKKIDYSY